TKGCLIANFATVPKGQARPWCLQPGIRGEVRLVERAFGIGPSALTEAMGMLNHHFAAAA
ncbi:TPA: hypothetical protein UN280_004782, partial [Escherichia coli]|nr:hypothetical protein [Escherichia coli]